MSFEEAVRNQGGVCGMVDRLCVKPLNFDPETACVCSGQWDYGTAANASATAPTARRRLSAPRVEADAFDVWGWGAEVVRRLQVLADPWQGSVGDYCDAWSKDIPGQWCFVNPKQVCAPTSKVAYVSTAGEKLTRSSGPCSDIVDSRSQFVVNGWQVLLFTLQVAAFVGVSLVLASGAGFALYQWPSKNNASFNFSGAHKIDTPSMHSIKVNDEYTLDQRFEDAQREAVRRLRDQTPDDMKFMLYGFYKQAKEGDVKSERLASWNKQEKSKYDYWARHRGLSREQAIQGYIKTVAMLAVE